MTKAPNTTKITSLTAKVEINRDKLENIEKNPVFYCDIVDDDTILLSPERYHENDGLIVIPFRLNNTKYSPIVKLTNPWTLDISTTTIDLSTSTGGLVDEIAREANRNYLYWGFLDENHNWAGIGITRKPFSTFSAISGGSIGTGATYTAGQAHLGNIDIDFTVVSGYQFIVGSRVVIRNKVGAAPEYEWNWATVTAINSDTSIKVDMDNNTDYGVNITGVTTGEIEQWDKFRPNVVTTTTQDLYKPFYSLLGEIQQDVSDNILFVYRKDDHFRFINPFPGGADTYPVFNTSGTPISPTFLSIARLVPLWSKRFSVKLAVADNGTNKSLTVNTWIVTNKVSNITDVSTVDASTLYRNAQILWSASNSGLQFIQALAYIIPGGMRE